MPVTVTYGCNSGSDNDGSSSESGAESYMLGQPAPGVHLTSLFHKHVASQQTAAEETDQAGHDAEAVIRKLVKTVVKLETERAEYALKFEELQNAVKSLVRSVSSLKADHMASLEVRRTKMRRLSGTSPATKPGEGADAHNTTTVNPDV